MTSLRTTLARAAGFGLLALLPQIALAAPAAGGDAPPSEDETAQPQGASTATEAPQEGVIPAPAPTVEEPTQASGTPSADIAPAAEAKAGAEEAVPSTQAAAEADEASAPEEPEEDHEKPHKQRHQPSVHMPTTNGTTPWIRFTTFVDYFGDNYNAQSRDDRFVAVVNYLNFGSDTRRDKYSFSTMARVDTQTLINTKNQPLCDTNNDFVVDTNEANNCAYDDTYRLERLRLGLDTKYVKVAVGDVNVNFGRGLGLSVRKELDIGNDPTLKGGKIEFRTKPVQIQGVAGVGNRQQSDYSTRQLFTDPGYKHGMCDSTPGAGRDKYGNRLWTTCSDLVTGGRIDAKLPAKIRMGSHYNFLWFGQKTGVQHESIHSVGGDFARANIGKHWDFFAGATGLMRNYHHRDTDPTREALMEDGIAVYTSNSFRFGDTAILVEGKYYDNYVVAYDAGVTTVQYAKIPTLERFDQQVPAGANTAGGRFRIDHTFREKNLTVYANMLSYAFATLNDEDMFSRDYGSMLYHGFVGFRWSDDDKGISLKGDAGYRWEGYNSSHGTYEDPSNLGTQIDQPRFQRKLPQARFFYTQALGHGGGFAHSASFSFDWRYEEVFKAEKFNNWHRGNIILGYGMAPFLAVSFIGNFSSEFCAARRGNPILDDKEWTPLHDKTKIPGNTCEGDAVSGKPHLWPGVEVRYNFLTNSNLRLFAGRQVGGLLCVNGSCRVLPDFEGVRMDLVFGF
jgi:hypothetical protein